MVEKIYDHLSPDTLASIHSVNVFDNDADLEVFVKDGRASQAVNYSSELVSSEEEEVVEIG